MKQIPPLLCVLALAISLAGCQSHDTESQPQQGSSGCLIYQPDQCPTEHAIAVTTESTTTTIDLSFLNTTTTTQSSSNYRANPAPVDTPAPASGDQWDALAQCETGGNWATNTGNGFGGGLQFAHGSGWSTWRSFGGTEYADHPWEATREQQIDIAERVLASSGWGAWPGCASRLGLR